ncbi:hypothetical protein TL16_g07430 [Triparma laevis f. inornata]|uniref:Aminopeptidase n=1 Tax=Triparma laevis f. inornata TaxID=1714386 RepID=A0A9W7B0V9_9STRA|nr:hypothetical protein TL16_g07430 [Triparma laevis f. inornata]
MSCRLPTTISPTAYKLKYSQIDLVEPFQFDGVIEIDVDVLDHAGGINAITLHCLDLAVTRATCAGQDANSFAMSLKDETVTLDFRSEISVGSHTLVIHFNGKLNDQMRGLYRSTYTNLKGEKKIMACTQFEATDARRAFPCWDEPSFKATFQLECTIPLIEGANMVAISNTPVLETQEFIKNNLRFKTYTFGETPKMSTYLAALVVGEFDVVSMYSPKTKIQTSVYTMPGKGKQGKFCLETASKALDFLEETYGIKYPLPKSDLLAIPDFASGAMENWGCVTYREAKILTDVGTSLTMKKGIARTVCHELAHQWFGNLTTMEWWNALFLNEGFARFMEFISVNHLFPEWNIWNEFVQSVYTLALGLDAMKTSHPIECTVNHPDEINSIFDAISYAKGASLLRMVSNYLGDDVFIGGIQSYLTKFSYDNAKSGDLWAALGEFSGKDVPGLMVPWTSKTGFPVIHISDDGKTTAERFFASGEKGEGSWPCPIVFQDGEKIILDETNKAAVEKKIKSLIDTNTYFKINSGQFGFFRVNYSVKQWEKLGEVMVPGKLSTIDRLGLISDCFALGKAGYIPVTVPLNLVKSFGDIAELDEYVIWQELSEQMRGLAALYKDEPFFTEFQKFMVGMFAKQAELLSWEKKEGENENLGSMRAAVFAALGAANDEGTAQTAQRLFNECAAGGDAVQADLRRIVYKLALKQDEEGVMRVLMDLYRKTDFPEEQRNLMLTLGEVQSAGLHAEVRAKTSEKRSDELGMTIMRSSH